MEILDTQVYKIKNHASGEKYYIPQVLIKRPDEPFVWRSLRMSFKRAAQASEYAQAVAARFNLIFPRIPANV